MATMLAKISMSASVAQISTKPGSDPWAGWETRPRHHMECGSRSRCGFQLRPVGRGLMLIFALPPPIHLISSVTVEAVLAVSWEARSLLSAVDAAARAVDSWA